MTEATGIQTVSCSGVNEADLCFVVFQFALQHHVTGPAKKPESVYVRSVWYGNDNIEITTMGKRIMRGNSSKANQAEGKRLFFCFAENHLRYCSQPATQKPTQKTETRSMTAGGPANLSNLVEKIRQADVVVFATPQST